MQKCYNCGKEVDDNVLICPDCGALVKRYGRPESAQPEQEADPFPRETAFDTQPQPRGAVWQQEDGKLKFSGYVTFWLVLCAIYLGNILLSFAVTLLVYRFRDFYFEILGQFEEMAYMEEYLRQLLSIIEAEPIRLIVVGVLVAVQFGCVVWFLASKRKLAFYILTVAAVLLSVLQLILGGGLTALIYLTRPIYRMAAPARQLEIAAVNCSSLYESRSGGLRELNTCRTPEGASLRGFLCLQRGCRGIHT